MVMPRQIDIDDSGDNLSGTPHNNAWLQSLQDKIDVGLSNVLTFPAAAVPSADPNRLDDYEEGTWTPNLFFGGAQVGMTFSERNGYYVKIGGLVWIGFRLIVTNKGSSVGTATISGLPFAEAGSLNLGGVFQYFASFHTAVTSMPSFYINSNVIVPLVATPGTISTMGDTHFLPGTIIAFGNYRAT